jgi:hypothetical protein
MDKLAKGDTVYVEADISMSEKDFKTSFNATTLKKIVVFQPSSKKPAGEEVKTPAKSNDEDFPISTADLPF